MKSARCFLALVVHCFLAIGQTGPGGVGEISGSSNLLLWLDADQLDHVKHGNNLSIWPDLSGKENHATQNTINKPNYVTNVVNGRPAILFDGSNANLSGLINGGVDAPATIFAVAYFDNVNQAVGENDYIFSLGIGTGSSQHLSISRRSADVFSDRNKYYSWDGVTVRFGTVLAGQQWLLFNHEQNLSVPFHRLEVNGITQSVNDYPMSFSSTGNYAIGKWIQQHNHHLDGYIAEIAVFNDTLTTAEKNIINSYFNAKYNISVPNDKYAGDDPVNGDNDSQVAGVGKEPDDDKLNASSAGITLTSRSGFQDGDYLLFGHNQETNFINSSDAADVTGIVKARWERMWWFDITDAGNAISVDISFDMSASALVGSANGSAANYKLLHRASSSGNWNIIAGASYYRDDLIFFDDISPTADGYYTIGTSDTNNSSIGFVNTDPGNDGPGGIGGTNGNTMLKMWLNANTIEGNTGDWVLNWTDQSGNDNHAIQSNYVELPTLNSNLVNGNSTIRFDGVNDYMHGTLNNPLSAPATIFIAAGFNKTNQGPNDNDYLFSVGRNAVVNEHAGIARRRNNVPADVNKYYCWDGVVTRFGPVINGSQWIIFHQALDTTAPFHQLYMDGNAVTTDDFLAPFSTTAIDFRLGRYVANNVGNYLQGDIGEIIIYNKTLNAAERNILNAYSGAKYDQVISIDKYNGDDALNGDHDFAVAGIGREADGDNLSAAADGLSISLSNGFGNGDYAVFGHNGNDNSIDIVDIGHSTGQIEARWLRSWYFDITNIGAVQSASFTFDFSKTGMSGVPKGHPDNYKVIFRAATTGNWTIVASGKFISGDQLTFENVNLSADGYFTLATTDERNSPLGPSLDFGNNTWNVYAFEGTNFDLYKGSYSCDSLSFDSRDHWDGILSPSYADTYSGELVSTDNHSVIYKRRSFPCGTYQLDITGHNDDASLYVNGALVWQHSGCCDSHSSVWTGQLNGTSELELRWKDFTGDSYCALQLSGAPTTVSWLGINTNWMNTANWSSGTIPDNMTSVVIPGDVLNFPSITTIAECSDLHITAEAGLNISSNAELSLYGNWFNESKMLELDGKVIMRSSCGTSSVTSNYHQAFHDLTIQNSNGVELLGGELTVNGTLSLDSGLFHTNHLLTLSSGATATANVAPIQSGSIEGDVTVERYIDTGSTNWRFLSMPVSGRTYADWNEDFITSGFSGSDFPTFPFVSIYTYDETIGGTLENGYVAAGSIADPVTPAVGYWVWCGDQLSGTQPFIIDVTGPLITGNTSFPLTYTASSGAAHDGWNMVGNPYASVIDWDSPEWIKSNVNNAIYTWDPDLQQYAAYVNGSGTNGGKSTIASSQAFWVQTNAASPLLTATELVKTDASTSFLKKPKTEKKQLRIQLIGNVYSDETNVCMEEASTMQFDNETDAWKLYSNNPDAPALSTIINGLEYSINTIPFPEKNEKIQLKAIVKQSGTYQLRFYNSLEAPG